MNQPEEQVIPGMVKVGGVHIATSTPTEKILDNIRSNVVRRRNLMPINKDADWRGGQPIAIVGGGPSLKDCLGELRKFDYIIAAGSVHDYLIENNITPTWCAICDPDPLVNKYLKKIDRRVRYLIASQCSPITFEHLQYCPSTIWHLWCGDNDTDKPLFDHGIYGEGAVPIGGGCTIGTRAMVIAMGFGFFNLHLFGIDTCVSGDNERYAYPLQDKEYEEGLSNDFHDIMFEKDGPKFRVLGYHLAQLFDIKQLSRQYANKMFVTVHGKSLLSYFYELAERKSKELKLASEKLNGTSTRLNGIGTEPVSCHADGQYT